MCVLLTGAKGQLGQHLLRSLAGLGEALPSTRTGRLDPPGTPCLAADLGDPAGVAALVADTCPAIVVNAAAYTAVDRAETDSDAAFLINAEAPRVLAAACRRQGALLVHFSTDYVFSGEQHRPWREEDAPHPPGIYGRTKLAGEDAIVASGCAHMIFRAGWLHGPRGHNFLRTILRLATQREQLQVVSDQLGTPTPAAWIAEATALALQRRNGHSGLWHLSAMGETSWHGFAQAVVEDASSAGLIDRVPHIEAIAGNDYPTPARVLGPRHPSRLGGLRYPVAALARRRGRGRLHPRTRNAGGMRAGPQSAPNRSRL